MGQASGDGGTGDVAQLPAGLVSIYDLPPDRVRDRLTDAMQIYVEAMGYPPSSGSQRGVHMLKHTRHADFRCRIALDDHGVMLGFGYGYTSLPGQWWHDLVQRAVKQDAEFWLSSAFELSELHVAPTAQGRGIGEAVLRSLADGLPHRTMLLSTPEADNRAWRLYRRLAFTDLARNHMFPGDHRPFGVLGSALPFPASAA